MGLKNNWPPVSVWEQFGYHWFRWNKKLRGPYTTASLAKKALKEYKRKKLGNDRDAEWKKIL